MNEQLTVKNFGPIKNAVLDLNKITVLIGPQGSGKSSLAKLVAIFNNSNFLVDGFIGKPSIEEYFARYQAQYFLQDDTAISFNTNSFIAHFTEKNSLNFSTKEKDKIHFRSVFGSLPENPNKLQDLKGQWLEIPNRAKRGQTNINSLLYSQAFPLLYSEVKKLVQSSKYIPTDRLFISSISDSILGLLRAEVALQKSTIEFGADFEIARSNNPTLFIDYLNITYKYENGRNLVFHNDMDSVPLAASASGFQSAIPLHLSVENFAKEGNTNFIIEEPELNLFPTSQKHLVGYLADKCTKGNNELLMTTHSPYVLSALNNLLFAYQVAQVLPERKDEIAEIIPESQWINPNDFSAYYIGEDAEGTSGAIRSIFNKKTGLIGENELDSISEELGDEFDTLMNIYRTRNRERVN